MEEDILNELRKKYNQDLDFDKMVSAELSRLEGLIREIEGKVFILQTEHNKVLDILDGILSYLHGNPAKK